MENKDIITFLEECKKSTLTIDKVFYLNILKKFLELSERLLVLNDDKEAIKINIEKLKDLINNYKIY